MTSLQLQQFPFLSPPITKHPASLPFANSKSTPSKLSSSCLNSFNAEPSRPTSQNPPETDPEPKAAPVDRVKLAFERAEAYKKKMIGQKSAKVDLGLGGGIAEEEKEPKTDTSLDFKDKDSPEVTIIVGDTSKFGYPSTLTPKLHQDDISDVYEPKVSTWGAFPRPANISKTGGSFGGGRSIQPAEELETEEERAAKEQRTRELIAAYKRKTGLAIDPKLKLECEKTELHGLTALQWAVCQNSLSRLAGKVALVTGGATGIGESIARLFHKHGAKVCIADLQDNLGKNVCESLGGNSACYFRCDVAVEDDVSSAIDFIVNKFGTLDIMVNNAGLSGSPCSDIRNAELSDFEKVFDINVKGTFLGMKHAARIMIPLKKGSIISLCSFAFAIGGLGPHAYTGSKHAVLGLTKSVAAELGKYGIRVNCVSPYAVLTDLALAHFPEERIKDVTKGFRSFIGPNANLQGLELMNVDVANAVLFLASEEAKYVSGTNLMVNGGFTSTNHSLQVIR